MTQAVCYLYVIEAMFSKNIKIGISEKPANRLAELQNANYEPLRIYCTTKCRSRELARRFESHLHKKYSNRRIRLEWFGVSAQEVYEYMRELDLVWQAVIFPIDIAEINPSPHIESQSSPVSELARTPPSDIRLMLNLGFIFLGCLTMLLYGIAYPDTTAIILGLTVTVMSLLLFGASIIWYAQRRLAVQQ